MGGARRAAVLDGLLVAAIAGLAAIGAGDRSSDRLAGFAVALLLATPLLLRRRQPVAVFTVLSLVALAQWALDVRSFGDVALLIALYAVAVSQPGGRTVIAYVVLEVGVMLAALRWAPGADGAARSFVALSGLATTAAVVGANVGQRRALVASLRERAGRLEFERDQQGRLSAAAERARIAREMHDVIAHNLSVMIALADGASYAVHREPGRAEEAMVRSSRTGRRALFEMRRLLGVLREDEGGAERTPQPGLSALEGLLEQVRAAGLPVRYMSDGPPARLSEAEELSVYRVIQEALTNTLKHAGPGAEARVVVAQRPETLLVEIADAGGTPPGEPSPEGRGLVGMHERATLLDGTLTAGPSTEGGWRVRLELPTAPTPQRALSA